ncbi:MAG: hypothetical protein PHT54_02645 [Candidatus Nanoarchaeia archaeon]|nr:hypothetical protein [Candidatus Nanoarchaeia archaeon]
MKKNIFLIVLLLFVTSLSFVFAGTLEVNNAPGCDDTTGLPYCTIQAAVNNSNNGDTVSVAAGTYNEQVIITDNINLIGAGERPVITGGANNFIIKIDGANGVTVDNVEVNGHGSGVGENNFEHGILIKNSNNIEIKNSIIKNVWVNGANGINIEDSTNVDIYDCVISSFHKRGIRYVHSSGKVYRNEIIGDHVDGVNRVQNLVNLWTGSNVEIYENDLHDALASGTPEWDSPGIFVSSYYGSYPDNGASYANIHDNEIYDCDTGIVITSTYSITDTSSADITNNNLHNLGTSISFEKNTGSAVINYNSFENIANPLNWTGASVLNAENNYWGKCDGPAVGNIVGDVDYTPWLGICIDQQFIGDSCVLENEDVEFNATISSNSSSCPNPSVWLEANSEEYTATKHAGVYVATIPGSDLIGGDTVHWKFVVEDCEEHLDEGEEQTFTVNYITDLTITPELPDEGWYTTNITLTLTNPSTPSPLIKYRWDGTGEHIYTVPFGLEDAPNDGDGLLELTWWSDVCSGEEEQNIQIYVDQRAPEITNVNPGEESLISSLQPIISATIKEPYQTDSQLDISTITMKVDNILVDHTYNSLSKKIDYVASLTAGLHTVEIRAKDYAGNEAVKEWTFTIDPTSTTITIFSPEEGTLNSKRQSIDILLSEQVAKLEYMDDGIDGKYKLLCKNCIEYNKTKTFKEGSHILKIMATNYAGSNTTEEVSFFIDSVKPKISQVEPKKGFGDGLFKVRYTEENPVDVKLTYEQDGVIKTETKTDCPGGKNQICIFDVNNIGQGEVNFTFEITDIAGFKAVSKKATANIDTIAPLMSVSSPQNGKVYSNKVQFSIATNEASDIYYKDGKARTPRWTRIASKATAYDKLVNFKDGNHEVEFKAVDPAGNTAMYGPISFEVI